MNNKKKQTVAVAMATALSVSAMMSPVAVHAQEDDPATAITQEGNQQDSTQETKPPEETPEFGQGAPANEIPQGLSTNSLPQAGGVAIDKANFPDDVFRQYVSDNFDVDHDSKLSENELNAVIEIRLEQIIDLKSLTGIKHMKNLKTLTCQGTGIKELDISHNLSLEYLACDNTNISQLDTSSNVHLKSLYVSNTLIEDLDVSNNTKLEYLGCHNTKISNLNISNNKSLTWLYCSSNRNLTQLTLAGADALQHLECEETGISTLDVSNNPSLRILTCYDTNIIDLDVRNNPKLTILQCFKTKIKNLDVSKNINLVELNCSNTLIEELDVTMLASLEKLWVWHTGIGFLNVSNSPNLKLIDTPQTNLAYLDWGTANLDELYWDSATSIDLTIDSKSFDITQAFAGIDMSKVHITSGATLNGNIITGYTVGTPITYTYDCGTKMGNPVKLNVTLNLVKSDSTIQITGNLDMTYTGKPMVNPSVSSIGSTGTVSFTYEKWNGTGWEMMNDVPLNVGKYRVQAHLAGDNYCNETKSEKKEFTISQAPNSWKNELVIADWTYGGQPSAPTATAQFGNPIFTYSDSKTGTFTSDVPVNAGTWYVKATVAGTDNYTGLESIHAFTISPKDIKDSNITVSDINNDNDVDKLIVKDDDKELVKGTDFDVKTRNDGNKPTVTITFKGNYSGTIERSYTVENSQPEKPEQKPQQDKPQDKPKDTGSVKTGDNTQTGLFATLGMMSAGCIALLAGKKRKKKNTD